MPKTTRTTPPSPVPRADPAPVQQPGELHLVSETNRTPDEPGRGSVATGQHPAPPHGSSKGGANGAGSGNGYVVDAPTEEARLPRDDDAPTDAAPVTADDAPTEAAPVTPDEPPTEAAPITADDDAPSTDPMTPEAADVGTAAAAPPKADGARPTSAPAAGPVPPTLDPLPAPAVPAPGPGAAQPPPWRR